MPELASRGFAENGGEGIEGEGVLVPRRLEIEAGLEEKEECFEVLLKACVRAEVGVLVAEREGEVGGRGYRDAVGEARRRRTEAVAFAEEAFRGRRGRCDREMLGRGVVSYEL